MCTFGPSGTQDLYSCFRKTFILEFVLEIAQAINFSLFPNGCCSTCGCEISCGLHLMSIGKSINNLVNAGKYDCVLQQGNTTMPSICSSSTFCKKR